MKRFHFTLQAVLTVRERQEQVAGERYAQALCARVAARERLTVAERECAAAADRQREQAQAGATAGELFRAVAYARAADELRQRRAGELAAAERVTTQRLEEWLAARQKREAVERLRGRQLAQHARAVAASEQKMLDELATQRSPLMEVA